MYNRFLLTETCYLEFFQDKDRYLCILRCESQDHLKSCSYIRPYVHGVRIQDTFHGPDKSKTPFQLDTIMELYSQVSLNLSLLWPRYHFAWNTREIPSGCYDVFYSRIMDILHHRKLTMDKCLVHLKYYTLISAKNEKNECFGILVLPGVSRGEVDIASLTYIGKTVIDRCANVLTISENPINRWMGYHWLPKESFWEHKLIPANGYPGKREFAFQMVPKSLHLWSDEYRVEFTKV